MDNLWLALMHVVNSLGNVEQNSHFDIEWSFRLEFGQEFLDALLLT